MKLLRSVEVEVRLIITSTEYNKCIVDFAIILMMKRVLAESDKFF